MKTTTDKRLTFKNNQIKQIAIAAAIDGKTAKKFMELAVIAATLQTLTKKSWKTFPFTAE